MSLKRKPARTPLLLTNLEERTTPAVAFVIDDFRVDQVLNTPATAPPASASASQTGPTANLVGGERDVTVGKTSGGPAFAARFVADSGTPAGFFSNDSNVAGTLSLVWDGADNSPTINTTGLGGINLAAIANQLQVGTSTDPTGVGVSLRFTIYSSTGTKTLTQTISSQNQVVTFDFASFTGSGNFTSVGAIQLEVIGAPVATDFQFDFVRALSTIDLSLTLGRTGTVGVGNTQTYTVTVANSAGSGPANNNTVSITIPPGLTTSLAQFPPGTTILGNVATVPIANLAGGASTSFTFTGTLNTSGNVSVYAQIQSSDGDDVDSTPGDNSGRGVGGDPISQDDNATNTVNVGAADFGDAPNSYGTTVASDGARHTATGVTLGATRDTENDAVTPLDGTGDGADEDGVTGIGSIARGTTASITVNASAAGFLNAWVDFNRDGDFTDAGEQIFNNQALVSGNNNLTFAVPAGASLGASYARFRITTATVATPSPTGFLPTGEVEDYALTITAPPDLQLTKGVSNANPNLGDLVDFTLTLTNQTAIVATSVTVRDLLPSGLSFDSVVSVTQGSYTSGTGVWNVGTVAASATNTLVIRARVTASGSITNYTEVLTTSPGDFDSTPGNNSTTEDDDDSVTLTVAAQDFGDAPNTYGTTLASNGARHVATGPTLGATRDTENDAVTPLNGTGDGADEDGVTGIGSLVRGQNKTITVNAPAGGVLDAWVDFDGSGTFDAGEQIFTNKALSVGSNTLTFAVPAGADINSFARFRIATANGDVTGPTGLAANGEVEDYATAIASATGKLSGTVFADFNNSGSLTAGEPGISGVSVTLTSAGDDGIFGNADDGATSTVTVNADGTYQFTGLPPGKYRVTVNTGTLPTGLNTTTNDFDGTADDVANVTLAGTQTGVNLGYRGTLSLGDLVWLDADASGTQNGTEPGIANAIVTLVWAGQDGDFATTTGNYTTTFTTPLSGAYNFANLAQGKYKVTVSNLPSNSTPTYDLDGGTATPDGTTTIANLTASRADVDFGYRGTFTLGDTVWYDFNNNGAQDNGEIGISGVTVTARYAGANGTFNDADDFVYTATTDASGNYSFGNLLAGNYRVTVGAGLPAGLTTATFDRDGTANGTTDVNLTANVADADFGYRGTLTLGDEVWFDINNDQTRNAGEAGIGGVTITLVWAGQDGNLATAGDNYTVTTTTAANTGTYGFANLASGGTYSVTASAGLPTGAVQTYDRDGTGTPNTATIANMAANITNADFGYLGTSNLGDFVWFDANNDFVQGPAAQEPGLPGLTVNLFYDSNNDGDFADAGEGTAIATDVTDGTGTYGFGNLLAGRYRVAVLTAGTNLVATGDLDGVGTPNVAITTLTVGQNRTNADFGLRGGASIGDTVWYDLNNNGSKEGNESGLGGLTVTLLAAGLNGTLGDGDDITLTTTTAADGTYSFGFVPVFGASSPVRVTVTQTGLTPTFDLDGTGSANKADTTLTPAQARADADFGYRGTASLGDFVWLDLNANGQQDGGGEVGIGGVSVQLFYDINNDGDFLDTLGGVSEGTAISTAVTSGAGAYTFGNLIAGNYQVQFGNTAGATTYTRSPANVGPDATDSDADAGTGRTSTYALTTGQVNNTVDAGLYQTISIGDRVWFDVNGNGTDDAGEPGIVGATVTLVFDANGNSTFGDAGDTTTTQTTSAGGAYSFTGLTPGNYKVSVTAGLPGGAVATRDRDGTPDGVTVISNLTASVTDADFGYKGALSLGDRVWLDVNSDGVQDPVAQEPGIPGLTVSLFYDSNNDGDFLDAGEATAIGTVATGANGAYTFGNLLKGNYKVAVDTTGTNLTPTFDLDGKATANVALVSNLTASLDTVDFGLVGAAKIGDLVWYDLNANGSQQANEPGLPGVSVTLLSAGADNAFGTADDITLTATTNATGGYQFAGLPVFNATSTKYRVTVTPPAGFSPTSDLDGNATANKADTTLTPSQNRTDADFGYNGALTLGNFVFLDLNANGQQDGGLEVGIDGVTVQLLYDVNNDGTFAGAELTPIDTKTTAGGGTYTFAGLAAGKYKVVFGNSDGTKTYTRSPADQGADATDSDAAVADGSTGTITLTANDATVDAGLYQSLTLGDRVWFDVNGNGTQDGGEPGLSGVTVTILYAGANGTFGDGDDQTFPLTTDINGNYSKAGLTPGNYKVTVTGLPGGVSQTFDPDGTLDNTTTITNLTVSRDTVDFGYKGTLTLGDRVWLDPNADGNQGPVAAEPGIPGLTVTAVYYGNNGTFGDADDKTFTTTTGANGAYSFAGLLAGKYKVTVDTAGTNLVATGDLDGVGTPNVAVVSNLTANLDTVDFGLRGTASIGDTVWYDLNANGTKDATEPGLAGQTVTLVIAGPNNTLGDADDITLTTTTAADGTYSFANVPVFGASSKVRVTVTPTAGLVPTYDLDSPAPNGNGAADTTLTPSQNRTDADFGYRGALSLGDLVFLDVNANGQQDGGLEVGINGVTVQLYFDANNNGTFEAGELATPFATKTTAGGGLYAFANLIAGNYKVQFGTSDGTNAYGRTAANVGNDATDSDAAVADGFTGTIALTANNDTVDAGLFLGLTIGDTVWLDANGNGGKDAGEPGIFGATVTIVYAGLNGTFGDGDDQTFTATTDLNGQYSKGGLTPGKYKVTVSNLPASNVATFDRDGTADGTTVIDSLTTNLTDVDFGFRGTLSLGDVVWVNPNGNATQDAGEPGIVGAQVKAQYAGANGTFGDADDQTYTTTTIAGGVYSFDNLLAGKYRVSVTPNSLPAELTVSTYDLDGTADGTTDVTLSASVTNVDFGYKGTSSIGDLVFTDLNGNGAFDPGEPGIDGATVTLVWAGQFGDFNNPAENLTLTTTTVNGAYSFPGLPTGKFRVTVSGTPLGLVPSVDRDATADGTTDVTIATAGTTITDADFGYKGTSSLGNVVFLDVNGNGIQDGGAEVGLDGVRVDLFHDVNGDGDFLDTVNGFDETVALFSTFTSGGGVYAFTDLAAGKYQVGFGRVAVEDFYERTAANRGANDAADSDADPVTGRTGTIVLPAATNDPTVDAGLYQLVTLGDQLFIDNDGNNVFSAGDDGVAATVTVVWLGPDGLPGTGDEGSPVVVNTDGTGVWTATGLPPGKFQITVSNLPPAISPSVDPDGANTPNTAIVSVGSGQTNNAADFGYAGAGTLGDTVWLDQNGNGKFDAGEGLAGVTVRVTGDFDGNGTVEAGEVKSAVTDGNGQYLILGLRTSVPGVEYTVTVDATTLPRDASGTPIANTVDPDGGFNGTSKVTLSAAANSNLNQDFGYRGAGAIGDAVFLDFNGNGVADPGEGLAGVTVTLTGDVDGDGTPESFTVTTDAEGKYLFGSLPAQTKTGTAVVYTAAVTAGVPAGLTNTADPDGGSDGKFALTLPPSGTNLNVDFGYRGTASVGDRVWADSNRDGAQATGGEPGVVGATIVLDYAGTDGVFGTADDRPAVATAQTGADGAYLFPSLPAGTYRVRVTALPTGYGAATFDRDGGTASPDGVTVVALANGDAPRDVDFGYVGTAALSGFVYVDVDRDGVRGPNDRPLPGVTITLTDGTGFSRTVVTGPDGSYNFADLPPGTYTVTQVTQPPGYADGADSIGTSGGTPVGTDGVGTINLTGVTPGTGYNFGELGAGITGTSFIDRDQNGSNGPGDSPLPGITVQLFDGAGNVVATTTTDANGNYRFPGLPAGNYTVRELQPNGFGSTTPNDRAVTLPPGVIPPAVDFGNSLSTVAGSVYVDTNANGVRDPGEAGIPGVTVTLTGTDANGNPVERVLTTDANGNYSFIDVLAGTYTLTETQPAGVADGGDAAGTVGGSVSNDRVTNIVIGPGQAASNYTFGELSGSITGTVFVDANRDGTRGPNEPGLPGVRVELLDPAGNVIRTTTTGPDGSYTIIGVPPGNYTVRRDQPTGYGPGTPASVPITVPASDTPVTVGFGVNTGTLSGYVYRDLGVNGVRETNLGETGIGGVRVTLTGTDARGNAVSLTTTTDASGRYVFSGLLAGTYTVAEARPNGFFYDGLDTPGSLGGTSPANDRLQLALPGGSDGTEYNFAENPPADPFGYVYQDLNMNGVRDAGEPGIAGVSVTVSGTAFAGTPLARPLTAADVVGGLTAVTNSLGFWEFPVTPPGVYSFTQVSQPAGFMDGLESNADAAGPNTVVVGNDRFDNVVLSPNPVRGPFNFGEVRMLSAGEVTKDDFLATSPGMTPGTGGATGLRSSPTFATTTGDPTRQSFVITSTGAGSSPQVRVFDFATGGEVFRLRPFESSFTGGVNTASADLNGDGVRDIVVTPGAGGGPVVRVYSGVDGTVIREFLAYENTYRGGLTVATGDVTGDGIADIVTTPALGGGPRVQVFDGATGRNVASFFAYDSDFRGGVTVAVGDIDGDGLADIVTGAGEGGGPRVRVFRGGDFGVIRDFFAYESAVRSGVNVAVGDADGDGRADIVTGAREGAARVRVLKSTNLLPLADYFAFAARNGTGVRVATQDIDGDGRIEVVASSADEQRVVIRRLSDGRDLEAFSPFDSGNAGGVYVG